MKLKQKPIYRPILQKAWHTTWHHKELWFFGIFAMFMNAGGIINVSFRTFKRASGEGAARDLIEGSIPGAGTIISYIQELGQLSVSRTVITIAVLLTLLIALVYFGLAGQASLLGELQKMRKKRPPKLSNIFHHSPTLLMRLLGVDILMRIAMTITLFFASVLFLTLTTDIIAVQTLVNVAILLIMVPLTLLIGYLSFFTLIEVASKEKHINDAIRDAWIILKKNWVVATEIAILLFLANFIGTILVIVAILVFLIPYLLIFVAALYSGISAIWIGTIAIGTLLIVIIIAIFAGFITSFTYSTWYYLYQKIARKTLTQSKLHRSIQHLSIRKLV